MNRRPTRQVFSQFSSMLFTAACVSCMIYQQYQIVDLFLQHKVTTTTSVYNPRIIDYLSVTICVPLEFMNVTCLNRETSSNYTEDISQALLRNIMTTTTAYTILKCTPTGDDLVYLYYYPDSNRSNDFLNPYPMDFITEKFLYRYSVCLKIRLSSYPSMTLEDAASSGGLGVIALNTKFKLANFITIAFGSPDKTPVRDIITSRRLIQHTSNVSKGIPNYYFYNHYLLQTQSLEYPYESDCFDYRKEGMNDDFECINSCFINKMLDAWNEVPVSAVTFEPLNYTFGEYRYSNSSVHRTISRLKELCRRECRKIPCENTQVTTLTEKEFYNHKLNAKVSFLIHHNIPFLPFVSITSRASQSPVEFFLNVLSTFSTWTGLSILLLNPVKLLKKVFSYRSKLMTSKQELDSDDSTSRKKPSQKIYLSLATRDRQVQTLRRDLHRIERLINTLVNSRLV